MSPISGLTAQMGFKLGPIILGTLIQHFLRRELATKDSKAREELLYDEAFTIVKSFMEASTKHTVEELQAFSNTRIPAPPWVRTVRVMIPLETCDIAADYLIDALGGKEVACKTVGGIRWWQVRGLDGIPGEWIAVRKDIEAQRRRNHTEGGTLRRSKSQHIPSNHKHGEENDKNHEPHEYSKEMEGTPCMLYVHGGGGYFGSIDQERYTMHRYARKMNGRVFAINYRLAPQYPFPCALHDVLSAYLYLIRPPEGAHHAPVDPSLIILAGDSAGGNLILAVLQVIRDVGLPAAAGAVLISPWCDLTHSFPSCMTNAASDIIPPYGLSLHRPSPLWPPPDSLDLHLSREHFATRLKKAVTRSLSPSTDRDDDDTETILGDRVSKNAVPGPSRGPDITTEVLSPANADLKTSVAPGEKTSLLVDGKVVTIRSQIQFYAMNHQLVHPLVSPALGYLGGLPPCLFLASDKELLRDEIIYCAHKAAHPERFPVKAEARELYPKLNGIEQRFQPTDVHLQVYDETCHVLPLFSFTTPAKYCYRAIASFCKYVTKPADLHHHQPPTPEPETTTTAPPTEPTSPTSKRSRFLQRGRSLAVHRQSTALPSSGRPSLIRGLSLPAPRRHSIAVPDNGKLPLAPVVVVSESPEVLPHVEEVSSPIHEGFDEFFAEASYRRISADGVEKAGHPARYIFHEGPSPFNDHMIRERVGTNGVVRALEEESTIPACNMALEEIGVLNENSVRRYIHGQAIWAKKFAGLARSIDAQRRKNITLSQKKGAKMLDKLKRQLHLLEEGTPQAAATTEAKTTADEEDHLDLSNVYSKTVLGSRQWTWGWAIDGENPPPSSIVARGDTKEARRLSEFADRQLGPGGEEHSISGNNLWSVVVEALTRGGQHSGSTRSKSKERKSSEEDGNTTPKHRFSFFRTSRGGSPKASSPSGSGTAASSRSMSLESPQAP